MMLELAIRNNPPKNGCVQREKEANQRFPSEKLFRKKKNIKTAEWTSGVAWVSGNAIKKKTLSANQMASDEKDGRFTTPSF